MNNDTWLWILGGLAVFLLLRNQASPPSIVSIGPGGAALPSIGPGTTSTLVQPVNPITGQVIVGAPPIIKPGGGPIIGPDGQVLYPG